MNLEKDSIAFLKAFYSEVKFDTNKSVEIADIAKKIGIENAKHIQAIWENLEKEQYLKVVQQFGVSRSDNITTLGIKKAEEYLKAEKPKNQ